MHWNKERNNDKIKDKDVNTDGEGYTDAEMHKDGDTELTRTGI